MTTPEEAAAAVDAHFVSANEVDAELLLIFQSMVGCDVDTARKYISQYKDLSVCLRQLFCKFQFFFWDYFFVFSKYFT
jgi:hypothetical protein